MFADIASYTAMMQQNEAEGMAKAQRLKAFKPTNRSLFRLTSIGFVVSEGTSAVHVGRTGLDEPNFVDFVKPRD